MTRGTISIKRKNGTYLQLWYVNSDGYISGLGDKIAKNLKTVDDVERAAAIFKKQNVRVILETMYTLEKEVDSIEPILSQYNDYSYVLDEETGKWGYYMYKENTLHDLLTEFT